MSFGPTDFPVWVHRVSNSFLHLWHLDCKRFHINFCRLDTLSNITNTTMGFFNFLWHLTMLTITARPSASLHTGIPLGFLAYSKTGSFLLLSSLFTCSIFTPMCTSSKLVTSHVFATPWTAALQTPLSMGCSRQEYWSWLPCPPPGDLPNPEIELWSPALQEDYLPLNYQGSPSSSKSVLNLAHPNPSLTFMTSISLLCEWFLPKNFRCYLYSTAKQTKPINSTFDVEKHLSNLSLTMHVRNNFKNINS